MSIIPNLVTQLRQPVRFAGSSDDLPTLEALHKAAATALEDAQARITKLETGLNNIARMEIAEPEKWDRPEFLDGMRAGLGAARTAVDEVLRDP